MAESSTKVHILCAKKLKIGMMNMEAKSSLFIEYSPSVIYNNSTWIYISVSCWNQEAFTQVLFIGGSGGGSGRHICIMVSGARAVRMAFVCHHRVTRFTSLFREFCFAGSSRYPGLPLPPSNACIYVCLAGCVSSDPAEEDDDIHRRQRQHDRSGAEEDDRR